MFISTRKIYIVLLAALAAALPFPFIISNILIILLFLNWIIGKDFKEKFQKLFKKKIVYGVLLFLVIHLVSLVISQNIEYGLRMIEKRLPIFILPLIILSLPPVNRKEREIIFFSFLIGCLIAISFSIVRGAYLRWYLKILDFVEINNFYLNMSHYFGMTHVYFGIYLVFAIIVTACFLLTIRVKSKKWFLFLIFILVFFLYLILCGSIMSLMALVCLSFFSCLFIRKNFLRYTLIVGLIFLIFSGGLLIKTAYPDKISLLKQRLNISFDKVNNNQYEYSSTRTAPLLCSLQLLRKHWLFGVGLGDIKDEMNQCYESKNLENLKIFNSHNQYLNFTIVFGIWGLIIYLLILFFPLIQSFYHKEILLFSFIVLIFLSGLTENILDSNKGIVFFGFFYSLLNSSVGNFNISEKS